VPPARAATIHLRLAEWLVKRRMTNAGDRPNVGLILQAKSQADIGAIAGVGHAALHQPFGEAQMDGRGAGVGKVPITTSPTALPIASWPPSPAARKAAAA
jgi:hypothetical protein